jgi:hypothetical protein
MKFKNFILIISLIFSVQNISKADDIRDFEIEGMSIGDSLLDFYSKKKINESLTYNYSSDKYLTAEFLNSKNLKKYDGININFLKTDKKMIIHAIHGMKGYNKIKTCIEDKKDITNDIKQLFTSASINEKNKRKHEQDKSGKSFTYDTYIELQSKDFVSISCYDWSNNSGWVDHLRISIVTKKFMEWINNEAYN